MVVKGKSTNQFSVATDASLCLYILLLPLPFTFYHCISYNESSERSYYKQSQVQYVNKIRYNEVPFPIITKGLSALISSFTIDFTSDRGAREHGGSGHFGGYIIRFSGTALPITSAVKSI